MIKINTFVVKTFRAFERLQNLKRQYPLGDATEIKKWKKRKFSPSLRQLLKRTQGIESRENGLQYQNKIRKEWK